MFSQKSDEANAQLPFAYGFQTTWLSRARWFEKKGNALLGLTIFQILPLILNQAAL